MMKWIEGRVGKRWSGEGEEVERREVEGGAERGGKVERREVEPREGERGNRWNLERGRGGAEREEVERREEE